MNIETLFTRSWYRTLGWTWVLAPLLLITAPVVYLKRQRYVKKKGDSYQSALPVIVVGNVTVGGTGKSPMVIALVKLLLEMGLKPGIVSRGHKRQDAGVIIVSDGSNAEEVGDEPLMLYRRTSCPVAVCRQRVDAVRALEALGTVDVIISDDGLQHYRMERDIEIAMIDAKRLLGNRMLLPVGPLRECPSRLNAVDFCFSIGALDNRLISQSVDTGCLEITSLKSLSDQSTLPLTALQRNDWVVVAGIGNPSRFKHSLGAQGLPITAEHLYFPDHHAYRRSDLPLQRRVIMTEKDAVKVEQFASDDDSWWYACVDLVLPEKFQSQFKTKLKQILNEKY